MSSKPLDDVAVRVEARRLRFDREYQNCGLDEMADEAAPSETEFEVVASASAGHDNGAIDFTTPTGNRLGLVAAWSCASQTTNPCSLSYQGRDVTFSICGGGGCGALTGHLDACDLMAHNYYDVAPNRRIVVTSTPSATSGPGRGINLIVTHP